MINAQIICVSCLRQSEIIQTLHLAIPFRVPTIHNQRVQCSIPSEPKKAALSAPFLDASRQKFENRHLHFLYAISFTGENFTLHNLNIFSKMYGTYFHDWSRSQVTAYRSFRRIFAIRRLQGLWRSSGRIFLIFVSQTKLSSSSDAYFELSPSNVYKNVLGAFSRFLRPKTNLLAVKSIRILEVFTLQVKKKVVGAFSRFLRPKTKVFPVNFRCILQVLCLQFLQKKLWAQFHELCVQKRSCLLWSSDAFWKFSPFKLYKNVLGAFSRFAGPKMKLFAVEFRCILEVLCLQVL